MTEKEKMEQGRWYDANYDIDLVKRRMHSYDLCFEYNQLKPSDPRKKDVLNLILNASCEHIEVLSPVTFDYGKNTTFGENVFVNINCYFMDGAKITIGNNCFIGPSCGFYTANHPLDPDKRNQGFEQALSIKVKDNCWIGANVSIMPGVTIGENSVIAAGAVVTKDVPDNCLVAGVPAKIIKFIE